MRERLRVVGVVWSGLAAWSGLVCILYPPVRVGFVRILRKGKNSTFRSGFIAQPCELN